MSAPFNYTTLIHTNNTNTNNNTPLSFNILYHGNCIDGWFSAYIVYSAIKLQHHNASIMMYPISPNLQHTWPPLHKLRASHVILTDVSLPFHVRNTWLQNHVLSVKCIDHHSTALDHWKGKEAANAIIDTQMCAALIAWKHFYPTLPVPLWLLQIDRIDRWDNPTYQDRCIREILNTIAHLPVQGKLDEALTLTELFFRHYDEPSLCDSLYAQGAAYLTAKDNNLIAILQRGNIIHITEQHCADWALPPLWLGKNVFVIDTTNITLDSTEAAYLTFHNIPTADVFINYRFKNIINHPENTHKNIVIYSARARSSSFDLTANNVFFGHPTSAGASRVITEQTCPFITL